MSEFNERVEVAIDRTSKALADGFDAGDVAVLVREAVEVAEGLDGLTGQEKRAIAIGFVYSLLDQFFESATPQIEKLVADVDWPLLPDSVEAAVVDPWVRKIAVPYARDLIKLAVPSMIDLVVEATAGRVKVNEPNEASA